MDAISTPLVGLTRKRRLRPLLVSALLSILLHCLLLSLPLVVGRIQSKPPSKERDEVIELAFVDRPDLQEALRASPQAYYSDRTLKAEQAGPKRSEVLMRRPPSAQEQGSRLKPPRQASPAAKPRPKEPASPPATPVVLDLAGRQFEKFQTSDLFVGQSGPDRQAPAQTGRGERLTGGVNDLDGFGTGQWYRPEKTDDEWYDGSSILTFDTQAYDFGPYAAALHRRVRGNWMIPLAARVLGLSGTVQITFYIERDGTITELTLARSSGIPSLDEAALNAIRLSSPLPPLPQDFPRPRVGVRYHFLYNIRDHEQ